MSNSTKDNSQLPFSHLHFPAKLYQIIEEENDDIICWNEDGESFRIIDHFVLKCPRVTLFSNF
jgi:hypothetical protein